MLCPVQSFVSTLQALNPQATLVIVRHTPKQLLWFESNIEVLNTLGWYFNHADAFNFDVVIFLFLNAQWGGFVYSLIFILFLDIIVPLDLIGKEPMLHVSSLTNFRIYAVVNTAVYRLHIFRLKLTPCSAILFCAFFFHHVICIFHTLNTLLLNTASMIALKHFFPPKCFSNASVITECSPSNTLLSS